MNRKLQAGIAYTLQKQSSKDEQLYKNVRRLADRSGKVSDKLLNMYEGQDLSKMGIGELEHSAKMLGGTSDAYDSVVASERKAKRMLDASKRPMAQAKKKPLLTKEPIAQAKKKPVLTKEGSTMNPLLQAGIMRVFEKQATYAEEDAAFNKKYPSAADIDLSGPMRQLGKSKNFPNVSKRLAGISKGVREAGEELQEQATGKPLSDEQIKQLAAGNMNIGKEGSTMNPLLQAGLELVLTKQAAEEEQASLAGRLNQKIATIEQNNPAIAELDKIAAERRIGVAAFVDNILKQAAGNTDDSDPTEDEIGIENKGGSPASKETKSALESKPCEKTAALRRLQKSSAKKSYNPVADEAEDAADRNTARYAPYKGSKKRRRYLTDAQDPKDMQEEKTAKDSEYGTGSYSSKNTPAQNIANAKADQRAREQYQADKKPTTDKSKKLLHKFTEEHVKREQAKRTKKRPASMKELAPNVDAGTLKPKKGK